ncbi:MAG: enoyl-CoA hydratase/isomerase family protein [Acidimicrobiales bacterium]|nr:enoyl-CoA hydratase/isomerase family protein [Acidimicrobiales bacterium]
MSDLLEPGYQDIVVHTADPVCVITLNRPEKLNAFTYRTLGELRRAVEAAAADPAVVGIVITGAGRGFSAGLDADTLAAVTGAAGAGEVPAEAAVVGRGADGELPGLFSYLLQVPKPVVAALNGVAAGGGVVLAALCDVRIASVDASLTTVFLKRGLVAEHGTSWVLPRLLGPGRALDLLWTSRRIGAEEALAAGMVEHVVPAAELLERAVAYVREIAANASPAAVAATKRMVYEHLGLGYADALRDADREQWLALDGPDAAEGAAALLEKRPPRFGRLGAP